MEKRGAVLDPELTPPSRGGPQPGRVRFAGKAAGRRPGGARGRGAYPGPGPGARAHRHNLYEMQAGQIPPSRKRRNKGDAVGRPVEDDAPRRGAPPQFRRSFRQRARSRAATAPPSPTCFPESWVYDPVPEYNKGAVCGGEYLITGNDHLTIVQTGT